MNAGNRERRAPVDRDDLGVRVRRTKHLDVEQAFGLEGVALRATHHEWSGRRRQAAAECIAGIGFFDVGLAVQRVLDRAIPCAAADVALQRRAEVCTLRLIQRRAGQDHARGAEAALKSLRIQERLLHRMNGRLAGKAFDGGYRVTCGAERRNQAAMHRFVVEQHGAGAAIAGVAAFLDAEMAELAQERAQALPGARLLFEILAIDLETQIYSTSSSQISEASRSVMCLRQNGLP